MGINTKTCKEKGNKSKPLDGAPMALRTAGWYDVPLRVQGVLILYESTIPIKFQMQPETTVCLGTGCRERRVQVLS